MLVRAMLALEPKARSGYAVAEHICAIGYAASEEFSVVHHAVVAASIFLLLCLALWFVGRLLRVCHFRAIHPRYHEFRNETF